MHLYLVNTITTQTFRQMLFMSLDELNITLMRNRLTQEDLGFAWGATRDSCRGWKQEQYNHITIALTSNQFWKPSSGCYKLLCDCRQGKGSLSPFYFILLQNAIKYLVVWPTFFQQNIRERSLSAAQQCFLCISKVVLDFSNFSQS